MGLAGIDLTVFEDDPEELRLFHHTGETFFEQMRPERIAIIQRKKRGHFASGGTTFKLEGLLQLYPHTDVVIVPQAILRRFAKDQRPVLAPRFGYQKNAYLMARYMIQEFLEKDVAK